MIYFVLVITGLAFGSFINALVWRLHQKTKNVAANKKKYPIINGRSVCPKCRHELSPVDLIPVISWLLLKGKCRYCHKPISIQYPFVELLTTGLFLLSYIYWPLSFNSEGIVYFVTWLILMVNLIALAVYDIRWMTLPDKIVYPLFGLVGLQILITFIFYNGRLHYIIGDALGLVVGGGVFYILFQLSQGKWIGGGDVKLGALLGLYLGSGTLAFMTIFLASALGSLAAIPLLLTGKMHKKSLIAYGPFLILAAIILRLFGQSLITWLNNRGIKV